MSHHHTASARFGLLPRQPMPGHLLRRCWNWLVQHLAIETPAVPPCWYQ